MTMTDTTPTIDPPIEQAPSSRVNRVMIVIATLILIPLLFLALLVIFLVAGGTSEDVTTVDPGIEDDFSQNPVAYGYFGEAAIAQGSTLTTTVNGEFIRSSQDVEIMTIPTGGLVATIQDGEQDAVQLELEVPKDMPSGRYVITFSITGEPEIVEWLFTVLPG